MNLRFNRSSSGAVTIGIEINWKAAAEGQLDVVG